MENHRPQVRIEIPLRHRDVDELGHVNQAVYHVLLEEVRAAFVHEALPQLPYTGYVLARSELDYRQEIRFEDRFVIGEAHVGALGRSSITIENRLLKPDGKTVAAEGRAIVVAWDPEERRARPLTDEERAILMPAGWPELDVSRETRGH